MKPKLKMKANISIQIYVNLKGYIKGLHNFYRTKVEKINILMSSFVVKLAFLFVYCDIFFINHICTKHNIKG